MSPDDVARAGSADIDRVEPILSIRDLSITFELPRRSVAAVRGVTFDVERQQIIALVGESGSGKSVTALAPLGLLPRTATTTIRGSVRLRGRELLTMSASDLAKTRGREIGVVFQDPLSSLNPTMTIGNQISEGIVTHFGTSATAARRRAIELLDDVEIAGAATRIDDYPHQFSGGMRQRVMLAVALSCDPAVLIADEPTTALDVTIQAQILDLLARQTADRGMSVVLITHDLGVVASLADRVCVMYAGRVVEEASTQEILEAPRHPYTNGLIRSIPRIDRARVDRLLPIAGSPPDASESFPGCSFAARCERRTEVCLTEAPPREVDDPARSLECHHPIRRSASASVDGGATWT